MMRLKLDYWITKLFYRWPVYYNLGGTVNWARTLPVWSGFVCERVLGRERAYKWGLLTGWR